MEFLLTQPGSVFSSSSMTWALLMTPRSPALSVICKRQTQLMFRKANQIRNRPALEHQPVCCRPKFYFCAYIEKYMSAF